MCLPISLPGCERAASAPSLANRTEVCRSWPVTLLGDSSVARCSHNPSDNYSCFHPNRRYSRHRGTGKLSVNGCPAVFCPEINRCCAPSRRRAGEREGVRARALGETIRAARLRGAAPGRPSPNKRTVGNYGGSFYPLCAESKSAEPRSRRCRGRDSGNRLCACAYTEKKRIPL